MNKIIILTLLLFMGCSKYEPKSLVVLADNGKKHNAVIVSNNRSSQKLDKVRAFVGLDDKNTTIKKPKIMTKREFNKRFKNLINALPSEPLTYKLYLEKNNVELTSTSKKTLNKVIKDIIKNSPCIVDIIGYSNMSTSKIENIKLSTQEANIVQSILREKILEFNPINKEISLKTKGFNIIESNRSKKHRYVEVFIK